MKIVINKCFGGFGLSEAAYKELGLKWEGWGDVDNEMFGISSGYYKAYRAHPTLIEAIEKIGVKAASDSMAELKIVTIPDGANWEITDNDGIESIRQPSQEWK